MVLRPVTLEGAVVRLEPLSPAHLPGLCRAGLDPAISRWTPMRVTTEADMRRYVERALAEQERGTTLPFAVVLREAGTVVGSTRFAAFVPEHRRIEIGWTWYAPAVQRTAVNTES